MVFSHIICHKRTVYYRIIFLSLYVIICAYQHIIYASYTPLPIVVERISHIEEKRIDNPTLDTEFAPLLAQYITTSGIDPQMKIIATQLQYELGYTNIIPTPISQQPGISTGSTQHTNKSDSVMSIDPHLGHAKIHMGSSISSTGHLDIATLPTTSYQLSFTVPTATDSTCARLSVLDNISYEAYYPYSWNSHEQTFVYNLNHRFGNIQYGDTHIDIRCHTPSHIDTEPILIGTLTVSVPEPATTVIPSTNPTNNTLYNAEEAFLGWINTARAQNGLSPYIRDARLDSTAHERSRIARTRGYIDHRRSSGDGYYDFWKIKDRFHTQGIDFARVDGTYFVENIGWGIYKCTSTECLSNAIRSTYTFFMSEASYNGAHYKSIMHPTYTHIGIGLVLDETTNKYYLTIHYGNL